MWQIWLVRVRTVRRASVLALHSWYELEAFYTDGFGIFLAQF